MDKSICSWESCQRPARLAGMCEPHYRRKLHGKPMGAPIPLAYRGYSTEERFWAQVNKNGPIPDYAPHLGPCWIWLRPLANGYGKLRVDGKKTYAHRYAYELLIGPIPGGLGLDHLCRVPACCNPTHLEPVTQQVNILRSPTAVAAIHARKTHCSRNHEFTPETTYYFGPEKKWRQCRLCQVITDSARAARTLA